MGFRRVRLRIALDLIVGSLMVVVRAEGKNVILCLGEDQRYYLIFIDIRGWVNEAAFLLTNFSW